MKSNSSSSMPAWVWAWICCPADTSYHLCQWGICNRVSLFFNSWFSYPEIFKKDSFQYTVNPTSNTRSRVAWLGQKCQEYAKGMPQKGTLLIILKRLSMHIRLQRDVKNENLGWFVLVLNGKISFEVICFVLNVKLVPLLQFENCSNNDTPFMNPSNRPHLSVNQQEHSSSQRGARLRLSLKNVQWPSPLFPSLLESAEHQACWTKNSYYLETMIWVQEDATSASRSHVTDS